MKPSAVSILLLAASLPPGLASAYANGAADADLPIITSPRYGMSEDAAEAMGLYGRLVQQQVSGAGEAPPAPAGTQDPAPAPDAAPAPVTPQAPPVDINPYDRDLNLTVPLTFNRRTLGEVDVLLTRDDRFVVASGSFADLIRPLLNEQGQAELTAALEGREGFEARDLAPIGIVLDYDPSALSILVVRIDPARRATQSLFDAGEPEEPALAPEPFSAYLNSTIVGFRRDPAGFTGAYPKPSVFLNGAVRYGHGVFEFDFQGREEQFLGTYEVDRRYARLVYDEPEAFRRWTVGDLETETRNRQGFVNIGGVGVTRQTRRFDSFRPGFLAGNREFILQSESTVRVVRNGVLLQEFRLDPGRYDISNLPLLTGSNDVELQIVDDAGRSSSVAYRSYLDAIDLEPGDYEYGAFLGVTSPFTIGSPDYSSGDLAFTGYFRKAFVDRPAIGVGLQASGEVQMLDAETQYILAGGQRLAFDAAISNGDLGLGYAGAVTYDFLIDRGEVVDQALLQLDYVSEEFASLGNPQGGSPIAFTVTGAYSRAFSDDLYGQLQVSYQGGRNGFEDSYLLGADLAYRVNETITVQAGVRYQEIPSGPIDRDDFGFTVALTWQPRYDRRADARYDSASNTGSVSYGQSIDNRVGAFGYSGQVNYSDGPVNASGSATYIGNRFDATISHTAFGRDFETVGDDQITAVAVSSSVAYAGGRVAVGRRIGDSFAIVRGHPTLEGRRVITGDNLDGGRYQASSGALGPALANSLASYYNQSLRYDVVDAPPGYDLGEGIVRVHPSYRSGYSLEIGTNAFVSAVGSIAGLNGVPLALVSGRVRPADDPTADGQPFFSNSVGRFAIQGLEPGKTYRVELFTTPRQVFEFQVPVDSDGLLNLQTISVQVPVS